MRYALCQYQARCNEQTVLQAYHGEHPTRLANDPPPNLGSVKQSAKEGYRLTDSLFITKFDTYLPADLISLLNTFPTYAKYGNLASPIVDGQSLETGGTTPMLHFATITISPTSSSREQFWTS